MTHPRRVIILCTSLILLLLSPWLISGFALLSLSTYGAIDEWRYRPTPVLSDSRWKKPDLKYRYSVLAEVIAHQLRSGMTQSDVRARLGEPDSLEDGRWQYEARRPGWSFLDFQGGGLLITFSTQETVVSAQKNHWVD